MAHIHEQIDFTVDVFVVFKNTVLIRKHEKYHRWLSVGGHIELNEDPNQAAIREVQEEVGLDVVLYNSSDIRPFSNLSYKELIPPVYLNIHRITDTHRHLSHVYFALASDNKINPQTEHEKDAECIWLTRQEVECHAEIDERIKFYAIKALDALAK